MIELEIDGLKVEVPEGSMVMDAATKAGKFVPHFCYHKKLSIAANCRMCLVQVEKAPKPLPACATPVSPGMKVFTNTEQATAAQKSVMELLLINHPLDCPVCDQGGECQLQDLAVGYGASNSRYQEEKRVVENKDLGALIATDMTRCIHCTRCVRFGQEIAGQMELGMIARGEHSEIMAFVGQTVNSELSGNMIDLCPVGALTSKPFRFAARTWELSRRKSVSPHDAMGSNLVVQVKNNRIERVVPFENPAINECWLSDRDRFSYEAISSDQRINQPLMRIDGELAPVSWDVALKECISILQQSQRRHVLLSPMTTNEETLLLTQLLKEGKLTQQSYFYTRWVLSQHALDVLPPVLHFNEQLNSLANYQHIIYIGSSIRQVMPLLAERLRQLAKKNVKIHRITPQKTEEFIQFSTDHLTALHDTAQQLLKLCEDKTSVFVVLSQDIIASPYIKEILNQLQQLKASVRYGYVPAGANSVGIESILMSQDMAVNSKLPIMTNLDVLLNVNNELAFDVDLSLIANAKIIDCVMYQDQIHPNASLVLPIASFAETAGSYINMQQITQSFNPVIRPTGDVKPFWKVASKLIELSQLSYQESDFLKIQQVCNNILKVADASLADIEIQNIAPILTQTTLIVRSNLYAVDSIVRRAASLQMTLDAQSTVLKISTDLVNKLVDGQLRFILDNISYIVPAVVDNSLAINTLLYVRSGLDDKSGSLVNGIYSVSLES
jgi:NADH-quinone oxidoreductase subunit G